MEDVFKDEIRHLIREINSSDNIEKREILCDQLKETLYGRFEGVDMVDYNGDNEIITDHYLNFDSNCGLTIVTAQLGLKDLPSLDDLVNERKDLTSFSLWDAAYEISSSPDRTENWIDLIDTEHYFVGDLKNIENTLDDLFLVLRGIWGEDGFKEDLKNLVEELRLKTDVEV